MKFLIFDKTVIFKRVNLKRDRKKTSNEFLANNDKCMST